MKKFNQEVLDHLSIIASEGLELSRLENDTLFQYHDPIVEKDMYLDGSLGLVKSDNNIYVPALEILNEEVDEEEMKLLGILVFGEHDHIPHADDKHGDKLLVNGYIPLRSCRRDHFTEDAWEKYKPEVRKRQAQMLVIGSTITAVAVTAGVLWKVKKSK